MDTKAIELTEVKVAFAEPGPANYLPLIHCLGVALLPYENRYDSPLKLESELAALKRKLTGYFASGTIRRTATGRART